jgi:hypothetical protein
VTSAVINTTVELVTLVLLSSGKKGITGNERNSSTDTASITIPNFVVHLYFFMAVNAKSSNSFCVSERIDRIVQEKMNRSLITTSINYCLPALARATTQHRESPSICTGTGKWLQIM